MKKYTETELSEILEKHKKWIFEESDGVRADLSFADLREADLCGANLSFADLRRADLCGANLCGANLYNASLCDAILCGASLCDASLCDAILCGASLCGANFSDANLNRAKLNGANLNGANLSRANLSRTNLSEADFRGANLSEVKNLLLPIACPEIGSFIAFKRCLDEKIVTLMIPEDAKRSSATSRKCRCSKAVVLGIEDLKGNLYENAVSDYDVTFLYRVGDTVEVPDFDDNRWNECAPGIHFFLSKEEAINY